MVSLIANNANISVKHENITRITRLLIKRSAMIPAAIAAIGLISEP